MKLIIVGAGSVGGHLAYNWGEYTGDYELVGFVDDDSSKHGKLFAGYPVIGSIDTILDMSGFAVVVGIAFPAIKSKIIKKLRSNKTLSFPSLISSSAWISKGTVIGEGCIIYPGVSINYGCRIDDFVVVNMNCAIGHNCNVGQYSSLAPGVNFAGHTQVGTGVDIGIGTSSRQNIKVGDYSLIGGQTMLIKNVPGQSTIVGVPGREVNLPVPGPVF